jgi:hypothetical protein
MNVLETTSIDALLRSGDFTLSDGRAFAAKLDCEGCEFHALEGAVETFASRGAPCYLYVETHLTYMRAFGVESIEAVRSLILRYDYEAYAIDAMGRARRIDAEQRFWHPAMCIKFFLRSDPKCAAVLPPMSEPIVEGEL